MTHVTVNGVRIEVGGDLTRPLLDFLRDDLGDLTPKPGCREGRCGACAVLVDGEPVASCLVPVGQLDGAGIATLRGVPGQGDELDEVQRCFEASGAVQCGICTSGMVMSVRAMQQERGGWTRSEIRRALVNNLCRCTGYSKILDAAESVLAGEGHADG